MRQDVGSALWLGHAGNLRDPQHILAAGIEAIIEVADSEQLAVLPRDLIRCRFPLSDGGANPPWLLRLAAESVAALLRANVPTLVCCASGLSRSVCVAAGGIAVSTGMSFDAALLKVVETGPADVSPRLLAQMREALALNEGSLDYRQVSP